MSSRSKCPMEIPENSRYQAIRPKLIHDTNLLDSKYHSYLTSIQLLGLFYIDFSHLELSHNLLQSLSKIAIEFVCAAGPFFIDNIKDVKDALHNGLYRAAINVQSLVAKRDQSSYTLNRIIGDCDDFIQTVQDANISKDRLMVIIPDTIFENINDDTWGVTFNLFISKISLAVDSIQISCSNDSILLKEDNLSKLINLLKNKSSCFKEPLVLIIDACLQNSFDLIKLPSLEENVILQSELHVRDVCYPDWMEKQLEMSDVIWKCLKEDGFSIASSTELCSTVVTDGCGVALGLVFTSKESLKEAIRLRSGIYFSRKRGLWIKGELSGYRQRLRRIDFDCDRDTLRFVVDQLSPGTSSIFPNDGYFCHRYCRTDWGASSGLRQLCRTLEKRRVTPVLGSYSNRLYNEPNLLKSKLVEEALELAEAVEPEDVASEAADLIYFALTRCIGVGVSLEDIERKLDQKAMHIDRRPGNAKSNRIQQAQQLLKQLEDTQN